MHSNEVKQLLNEFNAVTVDIQKTVSALNHEQFLRKPAPEKWSIAEIIEHINISDKSGYIAMLKSETDSEIPVINTIHKSFSERMEKQYTAPEGAVPQGKYHTVAEGIAEYTKTRNRLSLLIDKVDVNALAKGFKHPVLGYMSCGQWIEFLNWHGRRHFEQIKRNLLVL